MFERKGEERGERRREKQREQIEKGEERREEKKRKRGENKRRKEKRERRNESFNLVHYYSTSLWEVSALRRAALLLATFVITAEIYSFLRILF